VRYAVGPARFAGATYDPTSHYRAAAVFDFFQEQRLTPEFLRTVSQHQVGLLMRLFDDLDLDPADVTRDRSVPLEGLGAFLALRSPRAGELQAKLAAAGVLTVSRGDVLRLGPAPYHSDDQLVEAMGILGSVAR
jgi:kynureninase